jgi:coproporphyrinogen III oxidase-like Fe-S oxidoreductase
MAGDGGEESREILDDEASDLEGAWLGLRTRHGVPEPEPGSRRALLVASWVGRGLAVSDGGRVRLTPAGWLLLDRLAVDFTG